VNKRIILVIVIVAAVGLGVVYFREKNQNSDRILKVSGNIEAIEISLSFRSSGKLVECLVDEGYSVKRDKVLARLNKDELIKIKDGFITVKSADVGEVLQVDSWRYCGRNRVPFALCPLQKEMGKCY